MNTLYISPYTYFFTDDVTVKLYINNVLTATWPAGNPVKDDSGNIVQDDSSNIIEGS